MANEYGGIDEDGIWGRETTREAQKVWGAPVTGRIRHQLKAHREDGESTSAWEFDDDPDHVGDILIRLLQEHYGLEQTGHADGELIKEFQRRMAAGEIDGHFDRPSPAIREFQRRLNDGDAAGT